MQRGLLTGRLKRFMKYSVPNAPSCRCSDTWLMKIRYSAEQTSLASTKM